MATTFDEQPLQAVENEYVDAAPEDAAPQTKASVNPDPNAAEPVARFSKGEVVRKPVFANGERTTGVFTVYDRKFNRAKGYHEYQLREVYSLEMASGWTREKDLKPRS
ncbi:uncharacterized protein J4E88_001552 [Alternaria novae-zelandiae]|uniref:uncharacterized protein n=1 Tax=Alternaria novae-zelandiae TaxID=430562 RepID=UPI0020C2BE1F|nr:uncharacterized protein J4E88_001552 [Alternaria novae-zelandiae]KAI4693181.1 hypothetical protein J4E88_001552 [Alternaria novae-zelandiae]